MNDPDRKIEIDKSSLLSLKAELLRKQEEVNRAKAFNSIDDFVPKKTPKQDKPTKAERSSSKPNDATPQKVTELEDSSQLTRSKRVLVAKAKYYDRMVAAGGAVNSDENCLVMFNKKKQDGRPIDPFSESEQSESDYSSDEEVRYQTVANKTAPEPIPKSVGANDWVEYTDCLGRTRKCLQKDLELCLERDRELAKTMTPREGQGREESKPEEVEVSDSDDTVVGPMPSMAINETNIGEGFKEMRDQWAKQEQDNLEKEHIHYQDVLFDEARLHGVGYYKFSTDQQERTRQRDELDTIREATIEAQQSREELRKARDKIIADRVRAARQRQRARQGLPPEPEVPPTGAGDDGGKDGGPEDELYDTTEERRRRRAEEKQKKRKEKEERRRDRERAKHIRPWDEGKEGIPEEQEWVPAKERFVLSQHEWNERQRNVRKDEFAPPSAPLPTEYHRGTATRQKRNFSPQSSEEEDDNEDAEDHRQQIGPVPPRQGWTTAAELPAEEQVTMPAIPGTEDIFLPQEEEEPSRALFFTTKKKFKRRNLDVSEAEGATAPKVKFVAHPPPVPIRNELSDPESDPEAPPVQQRGQGAEIEPPPTYDYYGPSGARKQPRPPAATANLEASIAAGLKYLRNQSDKAGPSTGTKNRWTSNADY